MSLCMQPAKMLISIIPRGMGEKYVEISKAAGARGGTLLYGRTSEGNKLMELLSLADVQHEIVFTIMGEEAQQVLNAVTLSAKEQPKKRNGFSMLLDVSGKIIRTQCANEETPTAGATETQRMESGYTLISIIVNNGYADDVMVAARKAGATGGTILTARGTGTEEDVRFFGISLVPEKEMLLIVATNDKVEAVVKALSDTPELSEPGGGIVYTQNVEQFAILGK